MCGVAKTSPTLPTITGTTIGDTTTDGSSLADTWANIDTVAPVVDLTELTMIKAIP